MPVSHFESAPLDSNPGTGRSICFENRGGKTGDFSGMKLRGIVGALDQKRFISEK